MKKKKIVHGIITLAISTALLFSFSGCYLVSDTPNGIESTSINDNGELVITYTNGETENLGKVVGKDGADGEKGAKGDKGEDGKDGIDGDSGIDGIISAIIDENGELVITYSSGKTDNLGKVVGKDGADGIDGDKGADGTTPSIGENGNWWIGEQDTGIKAEGKDGIDGDSGIDGIISAVIDENGELIITYSSGKTANLGKVVGKDGTDGDKGTDGTTPSIGDNGNWWIGEQDTGIKAEGGATENRENTVSLAAAKALLSTVIIEVQSKNVYGSDVGGSGSGVIYKINKNTDRAFIITNHHVVYNNDSVSSNKICETIRVYFYGAEYSNLAVEAAYVGGSMKHDIAVIEIKASDLPDHAVEADIFDSDSVAVGSQVMAIGNAAGHGTSVTTGILSVDSETVNMTGVDNVSTFDRRFMRTDAAVNPGNSGGGLFDINGRLIGIVSAKLVEEDKENMGYAIPSNHATIIADNIMRNCIDSTNESVIRPILGVTVAISDSKAVFDEETGIPKIVEEIRVDSTTAGSSADGKLLENDIVKSISVNGTTVTVTRLHHIDAVFAGNKGDTITFTVIRDGVEKAISITVSNTTAE